MRLICRWIFKERGHIHNQGYLIIPAGLPWVVLCLSGPCWSVCIHCSD